MPTLYAQPYDISATGFYFEDAEEYHRKRILCRNDFGWPVEEFEIQFIDGEDMDSHLFRALGVHQGDVEEFFRICDEWSDDDKIRVIIAVGECGYSFDLSASVPNEFDVDIYEMDSLRDLAEHFIDEGLYGEIPESIRYYLDLGAMARDLGYEYSETRIAGTNYVYRCG